MKERFHSFSRSLAARTIGLAAAYFVAGKLALLLAIPPGYASPVWPSAGIALAGLLQSLGQVGHLGARIPQPAERAVALAQRLPDLLRQRVLRVPVGQGGVEPRVALCSHSQFGNLDRGTGPRMRDALAILDSAPRSFMYEGEMHSDSALDPDLRRRYFPDSRLDGEANVLIFANTDAASAVRNVLKMKAQGLEVGPILMGMGNRAHIVTPSITARGLLNIAALAGTPVQHYA